MTQDWDIHGPSDHIYTPAEIAQVARAAQAFEAALPRPNDGVTHLVRLHGLTVLDGRTVVNWPQPGEPMERLRVTRADGRDALDQDQLFGPIPCSVCGQGIWVDSVHVHPEPLTDEQAMARMRNDP
jgi:hypothetical protein